MPTWSRPADVQFDHVAAEAALAAIAAARFTLEWAWAAEDRSARTALGSWEGRAAERFRAALGARRAGTEELAARLQALAAEIEDAVGQAHAEQARVDALQAEWEAQRRLEVAMAAEAQGLSVAGGPSPVPDPSQAVVSGPS